MDAVSDADEHMTVQVHEALHHELQVSTIWGQIGALSALLAERGHRRLALTEVFDHAVVTSTDVHEAYATFLADRTVSERAQRDVLAHNPEYAAYRQRASQLLPAGEGIGEQVRTAASAAVLRSLMQPAGLDDLVGDLDFVTLRANDIKTHVPAGPDQRLEVLEQLNDADGWRALLSELTRADPRHQERILAEQRPTSPEDMQVLRAQWDFEVHQIQRRCHERVSEILAAESLGCLAWSELPSLAEAVRSAAVLTDPSLDDLLALGDEAPIENADVLEFARQRVILRERMPVELAGDTADEVLELMEGFVAQAGTEHEHVLAGLV